MRLFLTILLAYLVAVVFLGKYLKYRRRKYYGD